MFCDFFLSFISVNRCVTSKPRGIELSALHHHLVYAENVNVLGKNLHTINKNTEVLFVSNKKTELAVNVE
jgi:hypothetical protein